MAKTAKAANTAPAVNNTNTSPVAPAVTSVSAASQPKKRTAPPRQRHTPMRTCIICRQVRPKRELIRVVRTPDGHIQLDPTGKKSGRGAYLCARRSCWEPALRKGKLEHEFEVPLSPEDRAALDEYVASLPAEAKDPHGSRP